MERSDNSVQALLSSYLDTSAIETLEDNYECYDYTPVHASLNLKIRELWKATPDIKVVAQEVGIHKTTINKLLLKYDYYRCLPNGLTIGDIKLIKALLEGGMKPLEIAEKFDTTELIIKAIKSGQLARHIKSNRELPPKPKAVYRLVSPEGQVFEFTNMFRFSTEHGLNNSSVHNVLDGGATHHKGWTKYIEELTQ